MKSIKTKQKLYLSHFVNNSEQKQLYKKYANKLTKVKFAAKKLYYQDKLKTSKNNTAEVWRIIKSLLSSSRSDASLPQKLRHNNTFTTNPTLIANNFNDYFSDIGKILADQLKPFSENEHTKYLTKRLHQSLFLTPTTSFEVFNLISGLKNTKSTGKDNTSAYFLKVAAKVIAAPHAQLFNYTFLLGIFPASLKIAKIIPIYKSGDKFDVSNYRLISILSPISKILEKLIHVRAINVFNKHSVLLPTQYGFRANHSTSHALTDVLASLYDNINDEKYTALLLLDLKKAFDTVNHKTLLTKLEHYGICGPTLDLFASFLTKRLQYVSLENHQSNLKKINYGVPQGSVLGSLLFNIYINDISTSVFCTPRLFADDTCLIVDDKNINDLHKKITTEITSLNKWMIANKLTLNLSKSNLILIQPKSRGHRTNLSLMLSSFVSNLASVSMSKYLGLIFDNSLSFEPHINNLARKLSKAVGILSKVKVYLNTSALCTLYYALFQCHIQYGIITWSSTYKTYLKKLATLQNKAVKIVGNGTWNDRANPYYAKLKILKLQDLVKPETAAFVYNYKSGQLPPTFQNYFTALNNIHVKPTRATSSHNFFVSFFKTLKLQRSIKYLGPKIWNSLDHEIKNSKSLKTFKSRLKYSLLESYHN